MAGDREGAFGRGRGQIVTDRRQEDGSEARSFVSSSLLQRLSVHDADAWRRLVRLYFPLVRGWCLRARLREEDAADVTQEVFRSLAGNVGRFRSEGGKNS